MDLRRTLRDHRQRLWFELARSGHEAAFVRLYRELYDPVARYVGARIRNHDDTLDVVAGIFHKMLLRMDRFDANRGSVWTWVMTIARNAVIDHFRRMRETTSIEDVADELQDQGATPLAQLIETQEAEFISILRRYRPEVREMFAMRFTDGMRYREIAAVMGMTESAVKQRFVRTMKQLRRELEPRNPSPREGGEVHERWGLEQDPQESA